jgi:hypothetical protein
LDEHAEEGFPEEKRIFWRLRLIKVNGVIGSPIVDLVFASTRPAMGVDDDVRGFVKFNAGDLAVSGEICKWLVAVSAEKITGFTRCQPGLSAESERFQGGFGGFFAVEDGTAVVHLGAPKPFVV